LTLLPLLREGLIDPESIIIDAASGQSGAGRGAAAESGFCEINESFKAYKPAAHRHTPEIEQELGVTVTFTPHLAPMNRGIFATCYAKLGKNVNEEAIKKAYQKYYGKEKFIRLLKPGVCPETKWVEGSNYCDIGFVVDERTRRVIAMGTLDNLVKGAAGQAVQNMNIMFGFDEGMGISQAPMFP